jgi:hypothetical protein
MTWSHFDCAEDTTFTFAACQASWAARGRHAKAAIYWRTASNRPAEAQGRSAGVVPSLALASRGDYWRASSPRATA